MNTTTLVAHWDSNEHICTIKPGELVEIKPWADGNGAMHLAVRLACGYYFVCDSITEGPSQ